jgi:hypothetical protein
MREYILTPGEKQIITEFLQTGRKLEGFYVLIHRAKKLNPKETEAELALIQQFLEKASDKT